MRKLKTEERVGGGEGERITGEGREGVDYKSYDIIPKSIGNKYSADK